MYTFVQCKFNPVYKGYPDFNQAIDVTISE